MSKNKYRELAEQLVIHYSKLYDCSKKQQLILTGQLESELQSVMREREELFIRIEQLQEEFLMEEQLVLSGEDSMSQEIAQEKAEEIYAFRSTFQESIQRILTSDGYLQVIIEERKRQIIDSIQKITRIQNAEIQYRKANTKVWHGHLLPDQSRFFDNRK